MKPYLKTQIIFILSLIGALDAFYLTTSFFSSKGVVCFIESGCDLVTKSTYASWAGIPVALVGLLYYISIAVVSALIYYGKLSIDKIIYIKIISAVGLAASVWFTYLQFFVIEAFCTYCLFSAALTLIIFMISWMKSKAIA